MQNDPGPAAQPKAALPLFVAALCTLLGMANLGGWLAGERLFISIVQGLPAMVPVTAVLSLLTASSLWARWAWPERPALAALPAVAVIVLAGAIGTAYLAGAAPEPFMLAQSGRERPTSLSSPVTAGIFFALGCAMVLTVRGRRIGLAQAIALAMLLLALLNLSGYLFRDTRLFEFLPGRGTSILTTAHLILLSLGVLFLEPRRGLMAAVTGDLPTARLSCRLLLSAIVAPAVTGAIVIAAARAGLYDAGTVLPLLIWGLIVLLVLVIWRFALQLAVVDVARSHAERELTSALEALRLEHERKDVFLATLAHELRNPLAPVLAAAEVLRQGGAGQAGERQRIGDVVARQAGLIVALVDDLLDVERVSSGRIAIDRKVLDVRGVIADALEQVRSLNERRGHRCHAELPDGAVHVCGDHKRLVQIVANLLNNAAKYTPPGGTIRLRVQANPRHVTVAVADNGVGMDAALLQRLFEPYTQAALTSDRCQGGLGLGLWLARRLAALHGGTLKATSAGQGQGSTFILELPQPDQVLDQRGNER